MKAVVGTRACAISLGHLDFRLFMFSSYSPNQDKLTVSLVRRGQRLAIVRNSLGFGSESRNEMWVSSSLNVSSMILKPNFNLFA